MVTRRRVITAAGIGVASVSGYGAAGVAGVDLVNRQLVKTSWYPGAHSFNLGNIENMITVSAKGSQERFTPGSEGRSREVGVAIIDRKSNTMVRPASHARDWKQFGSSATPYYLSPDLDGDYTLLVRCQRFFRIEVEQFNRLSEAMLQFGFEHLDNDQQTTTRHVPLATVPNVIDNSIYSHYPYIDTDGFINGDTIPTDGVGFDRFREVVLRNFMYDLCEFGEIEPPPRGRLEAAFAVKDLHNYLIDVGELSLRILIQGAALSVGVPPSKTTGLVQKLDEELHEHLDFHYKPLTYIGPKGFRGSIPVRIHFHFEVEEQDIDLTSPYVDFPVKTGNTPDTKLQFEPDIDVQSWARSVIEQL